MTKEQKDLVLVLCKELDPTAKFDFAHEIEILDWVKDKILAGLDLNKKCWKISSTTNGLIMYHVYKGLVNGEIALIGDLGNRYPSRRSFGLRNLICRGRDCPAVEQVLQHLHSFDNKLPKY